MFRRTLASAAVAGVALSAGAALAATEIQLWHAMGGTLGDKLNEIAEGFNQSQSDWKVATVYKGNYTETMTGAIAAFRARQQPHIVQVFEVGTATMMAAKGAIYPVTELMKDTGTPFDIGAYLPAVVSYYATPEGDLLSMPFNSSTPVLWYNKDAFAKAGLDPESPPKTWAEMEAASKAIQAAGMPCGFTTGWQSWVMVENFSAWHNLPLGTKENGFAGLDTELTFNNEHVVGMIGKMADWQKSKIFDYGGRRSDSLPKFINAECAMYMNSSASYSGIKNQAKFAFGQTMLPLNTDVAQAPQNSIIGGATLWVLRGKPEPEYKGVAAFLQYLASPEVQADWHQATGYVPITTAAYELSKKQGFYDANPGTDTAIRQLSLNQPTANSRGLRFGNFVQIRDIINDELEAVWAGKKTAKQALDEAVSRGNELLRKFEDANS